MTFVPIIDIDRDPKVVATELDSVCRDVGFFQITGHDANLTVVKNAWDTATAFFDLPLEDRLAARAPTPTYPYGYSPYSAESLARSLGGDASPDLKEVFNAGPFDDVSPSMFSDPDERASVLPNIWPPALPEMRLAWNEYRIEMTNLCARVMSLFARALSLDPRYFERFIDLPRTSMRAISYPARSTPLAPKQFRAGAHTDYGTLTLLRQDTVGGLQVRTAAGDWADVESVPDAFVVNIGDLMARWTNDRWRSTLHRVVDPATPGSAARRQSMPFFHNANWSAEIRCLPTCIEPCTKPKYEPVLAGPHVIAKFKKTAIAH